MNKKELIMMVAANADLDKRQAESAVDQVFNGLRQAIVEQGVVSIFGFGTFEVKEKPERKGRNPKTGEEIQIPARRAIAFKAAKSLKDAINV